MRELIQTPMTELADEKLNHVAGAASVQIFLDPTTLEPTKINASSSSSAHAHAVNVNFHLNGNNTGP